MKVRTILLGLFLTVFFLPPPSFAADLGVGLTSYYSWWNPPFEKTLGVDEIGPSLLVGPALSLRVFKKVSLGAYMMIGTSKDEFTAKYEGYHAPSGNYYRTEQKREFKNRADGGFTLAYIINQYLNVFAGYKFASYSLYKKNGRISLNNGPYADYQSKYKDETGNSIVGYALGVNVSLPATEALTVILGLSGVYQPEQNYRWDLTTGPLNPDGNYGESTIRGKYSGKGFNATATGAYYFSSIKTVLTLGGRYQYIKYKAIDEDTLKIDSESHYGITFSAMYYFTFFE